MNIYGKHLDENIKSQFYNYLDKYYRMLNYQETRNEMVPYWMLTYFEDIDTGRNFSEMTDDEIESYLVYLGLVKG